MNLLKKVIGKILHIITQLISQILDLLISMIEISVTLVNNTKKLFLSFLGMGGCFLFLIFAFPLTFALLMNPRTLLVILFFILFPILGTKFVSYLKYVKYMITEFLFDHANYLIHGKDKQFNSFYEYGDKYIRAEEARRRKEQERRRAEQQKEWEEKFRMWYEYAQREQGSQGNYGWHGQTNNYGNQPPYTNPIIEFKKKYEESCDVLGIGYNADKYQVKLAYRKKAKEYHPDVNQSPGATKLFQQVNSAYEFLSDDHLERYKHMK